MIQRIKHFVICSHAELIKLRNTLAILVSIGVPFFLALINFIIYYSDGDKLVVANANPWPGFIFQAHKFWAGLLLSLTIILNAALINAIEHSNNTWKRIYSLPVSKASIYFSKLLAFLLLNLATAISFTLFIHLLGSLLIIFKPALAFQDFSSLFKESIMLSIRMMLASSFIVAFQFSLSFRFRSFVLPIVIGFCLTVAAGIANHSQHVNLIPYAYPSLSLYNGKLLIGWDSYTTFGIVLFAVISLIGFWESSQREIH